MDNHFELEYLIKQRQQEIEQASRRAWMFANHGRTNIFVQLLSKVSLLFSSWH